MAWWQRSHQVRQLGRHAHPGEEVQGLYHVLSPLVRLVPHVLQLLCHWHPLPLLQQAQKYLTAGGLGLASLQRYRLQRTKDRRQQQSTAAQLRQPSVL